MCKTQFLALIGLHVGNDLMSTAFGIARTQILAISVNDLAGLISGSGLSTPLRVAFSWLDSQRRCWYTLIGLHVGNDLMSTAFGIARTQFLAISDNDPWPNWYPGLDFLRLSGLHSVGLTVARWLTPMVPVGVLPMGMIRCSSPNYQDRNFGEHVVIGSFGATLTMCAIVSCCICQGICDSAISVCILYIIFPDHSMVIQTDLYCVEVDSSVKKC